MKKELTPEQLEALSFDRHIALTANAGSGKTSVLQQRYVNILMSNEKATEPRNVVAITFTREAASEILAKVSKNIEDRIEKETHLPKKIRLARIRDKLNNTPISTIHSFCSSLLRSFPIETNLPPNFGELTNYEKKEIYSNSIVQAMEEWLENGNIDRRERIRKLIFTFGRKNVEDGIRFLLFKRERFEWLKRFYEENSQEDFLQIRDELIIRKLTENTIITLEKASELVDLLVKRNPEKFSNLKLSSNEIGNIIVEFEKFINDIKSSLKTGIIGNILLKTGVLIKTLFNENVIKAGYSINLTTAKKYLEEDEIFYFNQYLINLQDIAPICTSYDYSESDKELFHFAKLFTEITSDVIDIINDEKEVLAGIDFDDQLIKTSELLNNDEVVRKIRRKIKYLMIDEFQDTNELQYDIVKKLIPELTGKKVNGTLNFYVVGDEKQSIYGFRNADVRVFEKAKKDIAETNRRDYEELVIPLNPPLEKGENKDNNPPLEKGENKDNNPPLEKGENKDNSTPTVNGVNNKFGNLNLTVTFRLAPVPAAFVNKVCGKLFEKVESEYDVSYSSLVCHKEISRIIEKENINNEIDLANKDFGNVTFLITDFKNSGEESEVISEAKSLALYIKNLAIKQGKDWSDFGILGRSRKGFDELISEFQEQNIPYILHSGKGFYKSQEVVDVCSILSFLHNHDDNKALAAALRSPYFKISDEILFKAGEIKNCYSLWSKFKKYCDSIEEKVISKDIVSKEEQNCLRALKILTELSYRAVRISIPQLIHKIIDLCSWNSVISELPSEKQMKANINKLIQIARDFEKRGFKNLYDFVEQVKGTISADLTESEAVFLSDENAVNIMTIHASKGLEFDTVCLYNSDNSHTRNTPYIISDDFGFSFKMIARDETIDINKEIITPTYLLANDKQNKAEWAESKRLLYVALTRAENNIIISGSINKKRQTGFQKSELYMIMKSLDDKLTLSGDLKEMSICDSLKSYHNNQFHILKIKYTVKFLFNYSEKTDFELNGRINQKPEPCMLLTGVKSDIDNEVFSATKLMTFQNDSEEYAKRYLFGLPSVDDINYDSINHIDKTRDDDVVGSLAGTLIHSVLERIKDWLKSDAGIDDKILRKVIDNVISDSNKKISNKLSGRIFSECSSVANTTLIKLYAKHIKESIPEQTLQMVYKNDLLLVKTDLLIKNASGEWEVWDWKTNRVGSNEVKNTLIKYYELQMKIYIYFLMKLYPEQKNFKARLLFTRLAKISEIPLNPLLKKGENSEDWVYTFNWTIDDLNNIEREINKIADKIRIEQI